MLPKMQLNNNNNNNNKYILYALEQVSVVKNIDISINIDTEISERYQY